MAELRLISQYFTANMLNKVTGRDARFAFSRSFWLSKSHQLELVRIRKVGKRVQIN